MRKALTALAEQHRKLNKKSNYAANEFKCIIILTENFCQIAGCKSHEEKILYNSVQCKNSSEIIYLANLLIYKTRYVFKDNEKSSFLLNLLCCDLRYLKSKQKRLSKNEDLLQKSLQLLTKNSKNHISLSKPA